MRQELKQQLDKVGYELVQEIDPDHGLFRYLLDSDVLTEDQVATCKAKEGRFKKVDEILTLLKCQPDNCYFKFCGALEKINRSDLVDKYLIPCNFQAHRPTPRADDKKVRLSTTAADFNFTGVLDNNFRAIARCLTVTDALVADLMSAKYLKDRMLEIELQQTPQDKVNKLLRILRQVPQQSEKDVSTVFFSALRQDGQEHVANLFTKESEAMPMSDEHHQLLSRKVSELCKFIEPLNGLLDELNVSSEVFNVTDISRVRHCYKLSGCDEASRDIIDILCRKSDDAFDKFISALHRTCQGHVARILGDPTGSLPMSEEHRRILSDKKSDMSKCIDSECGLLDDLLDCGCFSDFDAERVRQTKGLDAMSREVVDILLRKPDDSFTSFINALNNTNQGHVVSILGEPSICFPMSREHRCLLVSKKCKIVEFMDPECGLLDILVSQDIFNEFDESRINSSNTIRQNKAAKVVELLLRKSDIAFDTFISALTETGHEHVVYILTGAGDPPLSERRLKILRKMRDKLIQNIDSEASSTVSQLFKYDVINSIERDIIEKQQTVVTRNEMVLNAVERKSDASYDKFLQALIDTGQEHIAKALNNLEVNGTLNDTFYKDVPAEYRNQMTRLVVKRMLPLATGQGCGDDISEIMAFLQQKGFEIIEVANGSILITFGCYTEESLANLKRFYADKTLDRLFTEAFCPQFADEGLESLTLCIKDEEFERCYEALKQLAVPTDELIGNEDLELCETRVNNWKQLVYSRKTDKCKKKDDANVSISAAERERSFTDALHKSDQNQVARIHRDQSDSFPMSSERTIAITRRADPLGFTFTGDERAFRSETMRRGASIDFDDVRRRIMKGFKPTVLHEISDTSLLNGNIFVGFDKSNRTNQNKVQSLSNAIVIAEPGKGLIGLDGCLAIKNANKLDESKIGEYEKVHERVALNAIDILLRKSGLETFNNAYTIPILAQLLKSDESTTDNDLRRIPVKNNEIIFSQIERKFHNPYAPSNSGSSYGTMSKEDALQLLINATLQHGRNKFLWTILQDNKTIRNLRN